MAEADIAYVATAGAAGLAMAVSAWALLMRGRRTALPRHRTLRGALDWSYDLLAPPLQQLLDQLQLSAEMLPDGLRIGNLDSQQLLAITQFLATQPSPPSLLRFGRPSLEQLYLSLNGGRL